MQNKRSSGAPKASLNRIQKQFSRAQLILIVSLALILGVAGTLINVHFETQKRDQNLRNVAEAIANSPLLAKSGVAESAYLTEYLDTLKDTLQDIDVISVLNQNGVRAYHSNHALIGTEYEGNLPDFAAGAPEYYAVNEKGVSGRQRRAYAAIYNADGDYAGLVMAIMLRKNIETENAQLLAIFCAITAVAVLMELIIARTLSGRVKKSLMGYEPDAFTAMYKMRDNILETLEEGIVAFDADGIVQFANRAAVRMLCGEASESPVGKRVDALGDEVLSRAVNSAGRSLHVNLAHESIILDRVPILEDGCAVGAIAILHNRGEYTRLMEELSGTRYLVDSMRANNHDFTNKLHVILGLIQMGMYDEASAYIQNITMVQRENISRVMNAVDEPSVAALLIGKIARASELNVKFILREGSRYCAADMNLPSEMLITVIGNLLDNAFDAMNEGADFKRQKELMFGIYSKPGAVLICVDDTGSGIKPENLNRIFENGYSTKGEGRGVGLYQIKAMIENCGGTISVESQEGVGSSFTVSFAREEKNV